jgi:hypothetical protein
VAFGLYLTGLSRHVYGMLVQYLEDRTLADILTGWEYKPTGEDKLSRSYLELSLDLNMRS